MELADTTKELIPYREPVGVDNVKAFIPGDFPSVYRYAELLADSGDMVPKAYVGNPSKISTAIFFGYEIGLMPMQALQSIAVINGKPSIYGDAALALVRGSGLLEDFEEYFEGDYLDAQGKLNLHFKAVCKITRVGAKRPTISEFSLYEAQEAGLINKDGPWRQYRKRMLKMRARAFGLRDEFTDVLRGIGISEEVRDHSDTYDSATDDTPPKPPADAITDETTTDAAPKRRGRPAGKRSSVAEEASKGTVVDAEVVTDQDPPTPADDDPPKPEETTKPVETAKPAEQAKREQEKPAGASKAQAAPKEQAKPAETPAATPAKKTPGQELSGMIATWGELGEKMQATLKEMHTAMYQCSDLEPGLRGVWSKFFGGFTPSTDADLKAKQDAAMKQVRNFHKDRITNAAAPPAENDPPAPEDDPPTPEDEDVRFDIDGFRRELDGAMSDQTTPAGVNRTYSEFMEGPRRDGLISDDQFEDVFQPLLQEHLLRVDDFDK